MDYVYRLENLDCANCAQKVESAVLRLAGVRACSVNFMTLKMTVNTQDGMTEALLKDIGRSIARVDSRIRLKLK